VITIDEKGVIIRDLKSRNGVVINGTKVEKGARLKVGDKLQIGKLKFEVMIDHTLGGSKKPKVKDMKEAAVRSASSKGAMEEEDVASWLDEADDMDKTRKLTDPDTRQFKLDETERVLLNDETTETKLEAQETKPADEEKKKPGKLPMKAGPQSNDSREAASDMLRKFFNRR